MLIHWVKTIWAKGGEISPSWGPTIIFSEKKSWFLNNLSLDHILKWICDDDKSDICLCNFSVISIWDDDNDLQSVSLSCMMTFTWQALAWESSIFPGWIVSPSTLTRRGPLSQVIIVIIMIIHWNRVHDHYHGDQSHDHHPRSTPHLIFLHCPTFKVWPFVVPALGHSSLHLSLKCKTSHQNSLLDCFITVYVYVSVFRLLFVTGISFVFVTHFAFIFVFAFVFVFAFIFVFTPGC